MSDAPIKPSQRIEEIRKKHMREAQSRFDDTLSPSTQNLLLDIACNVQAIIDHLDEQHAKSGIIS